MREKKRIFREANSHIGFWTMWLTLFTGLLGAGTLIGAIIAMVQLHNLSETTKADFILKFKDSFFKKESRELMSEIDYNKLKFVVIDSIPYFRVNRNNHDTIISAYEIDENLLNHFDDIGLFQRKEITSQDMIFNMFSWYIEECWEDVEIHKYIIYERAKYGNEIFQDFEYIYNQCKQTEYKYIDTATANKRKK